MPATKAFLRALRKKHGLGEFSPSRRGKRAQKGLKRARRRRRALGRPPSAGGLSAGYM